MPAPIEDYAMISDCQSAALLNRDGSIDWLCFPRYDSPSMFGAMLGDTRHGRWQLRPTDPSATSTRAYLPGTFVLVTRWSTATGEAEVTEFMPYGNRRADLARRVTGITGEVEFEQRVTIRFGYASAIPWVRQGHKDGGPYRDLHAVAGPDAIVLRGPRLKATDTEHRGRFTVQEGKDVDAVLTWYPSYRRAPEPIDVGEALATTVDWWRAWAEQVTASGAYHEAVERSLLTLKALTHEDTGGIVAAATTSL